MEEIGLREIRQNASDIVRRAQAGELMTITVSGRPAAQVGPVDPPAWVSWDDIADVFSGPGDAEWDRDRDLVAHDLRDPWAG